MALYSYTNGSTDHSEHFTGFEILDSADLRIVRVRLSNHL